MKLSAGHNNQAGTNWAIPIFAALVFILICLFMFNIDSASRRKRTNRQMQSLADRVKANPDDKEALQKLISHLNDSYRSSRVSAAYSLGSLRGKAKDAVPSLGRCLKSTDGFMRRAASQALQDIGVDSKAAIPDLIDALKLGNEDTAWLSAQLLGLFPDDSKIIVPALIASLQTHDLDNLYGDPGTQLAFEAADSLAKFGTNAIEAIPALKAGLAHTNIQLKFHFSAAIWAINPQDEESLQTLVEFLKHPWMDSWVLMAFEELGTNAPMAIPLIEDYLKRNLSPSARQQAEYTLTKIRGKSP